MASPEWISQFSQDIPASQPDRSQSHTPRRQQEAHTQGQVPQFRGPLHQAMQFTGPPWQPYGMISTPPRMPSTSTPNFQPPSHLPCSNTFPPPPSMFPPPPPPVLIPPQQRVYTTTPKSPATPSPQQTKSQIKTGYQVRAIEIPPVDDWTPDDIRDMFAARGPKRLVPFTLGNLKLRSGGGP